MIMARLFVTVLLCVFASALAFQLEGDVIVGTDDTLQQIIDGTENVLVEFYAPWCGHCKTLAPEWAKAATALKSNENVKLVKVDATVEKNFAETVGVRGFPTIKFYKNGKVNDYSGGRTADEIVNWLNKRTGPAFVNLETAEAVADFRASKDVVVIGAFSDASGEAATAFKQTAESVDDVVFGIASDASFLADITPNADNTIVLYKNFEEGHNVFDGAYETAEIAAFIKKNQLPTVIEFTQESAPKIFGGDAKIHFLLFLDEAHEAALSEFRAAAQTFKGRVLFVYMYGTKADSKRIMEYFNVDGDSLPDARLIDLNTQDMNKYKMESQDFTNAGYSTFLNNFLNGEIKEHLKSEDVVEYSGKGVYTLVGHNHDEVARSADKNVFVEYYAPWCGHCKSLAPIWDELATAFDDTNVVIAKMDSTVNEAKGVKIEGFPTLKFYPAGGDAIDYSGARELKALKQFVLENAVNLDTAHASKVRDEL